MAWQWHGVVWYEMGCIVQYVKVWTGAMICYAMACYGTAWHITVWYGMACYGMAWYVTV